MNRVAIGLMSTALMLTAGCSTSVPRALDAPSVPAKFTGPFAPDSPIWPDSAWWQAFGDSQLTELVHVAEVDNRDLAAAAARVLQAQAESTIQRATLFPQLSGELTRTSAGCRGNSCLQYLAGKTQDLTLNANYQLDLWGVARASLRAALEDLKSARFAKQSVALAVEAATANQYFTVLAVRQRMAIAHEYIDAINAILRVIELRVRAGSVSHLDLAQEQAQLEAVEAQLPGLKTTEQEALFTLAQLLGRPPEGFQMAGRDLDRLGQPQVRAGLPSELLLRRPDAAQAEANLAAAHADLDAARAAFLPQISLTGSGGFVSTAIGALLQGANFGYSYGAALVQTIFDGGRLSGQKALASGVQQESLADYQSTVLHAFVDVESALIEVESSGKAQQHLSREVAAAREAFDIAELQYRQGATDLLTVLQAQQTLFLAEDQLVQLKLANCQAAVHLYQALGGGWTESVDERTQHVPATPLE